MDGMLRKVGGSPIKLKGFYLDFSGGPVVKTLPANAGYMNSISGLGRFHMLWNN